LPDSVEIRYVGALWIPVGLEIVKICLRWNPRWRTYGSQNYNFSIAITQPRIVRLR